VDKHKIFKVEVKIENKPHCLIELEVKAPKELIQEAIKEAINEVKKEVSLPGFRKGKAPIEIIQKKYSHSILEKKEKKIADLSFISAHTQEKLPAIHPGSRIIFNLKNLTDDEATIFFAYEKEPEIPTIDPKLFKLKEIKKHEVTDKEIDEALRQMRFFFAKFISVERPIKEDDYIIIDLDSVETDQRVFSDTRFEVSEKGMANWMKELVLGANVGDVLHGISKADEDLTQEEKEKFEPKKVKVTIKKIEEAELPLLDDQLANKVGSKNVEEMKSFVKNMLTSRSEEGYDKKIREQVDHFLLKEYKFDIPNSLLHTEIESRKSSYLADPLFKQQFNKMSEDEKKSFEKDLEKHSKDALRIFYLTRKIIEDQNLKISEDEITQEAVNLYYKQSGGVKIPDPKNIPKDVFALALSKLCLKKAQDYILEHYSKT